MLTNTSTDCGPSLLRGAFAGEPGLHSFRSNFSSATAKAHGSFAMHVISAFGDFSRLA